MFFKLCKYHMQRLSVITFTVLIMSSCATSLFEPASSSATISNLEEKIDAERFLCGKSLEVFSTSEYGLKIKSHKTCTFNWVYTKSFSLKRRVATQAPKGYIISSHAKIGEKIGLQCGECH